VSLLVSATRILFHQATKTVRIEMVYRSFRHFSPKPADNFVPLPYQPENNDIPGRTPVYRSGDRAGRPPTGVDALRTLAVSRNHLDNFDLVTAYEAGVGPKSEIQPVQAWEAVFRMGIKPR
jgi:2-iminoacetate synthase ThiH